MDERQTIELRLENSEMSATTGEGENREGCPEQQAKESWSW